MDTIQYLSIKFTKDFFGRGSEIISDLGGSTDERWEETELSLCWDKNLRLNVNLTVKAKTKKKKNPHMDRKPDLSPKPCPLEKDN